ncbi:uncharacterized protein ACRADG_001937 isoform 2-T4 [Cochliomyia hominivorax]
MQDISRDDFPLLNGADGATHTTDKDNFPALIYKIQNISPLNSTTSYLPKQYKNEENVVLSYTAVKLEDINTIDLFSSQSSTWQQHPISANNDLDHHMFTNLNNRYDNTNTKLLLQGSDDPLISHGAHNVLSHDDEHPADFAKNLITQTDLQNTVKKQNFEDKLSKFSSQQSASQRLVKSGCSNLTKQQLKAKASQMSARNQQQLQNQCNISSITTSTTICTSTQKQQRTQKSRNKKGNTVKLRFHHQALPPEYLSHYEATQGHARISKNPTKTNTGNLRPLNRSINSSQKPSQNRNSHENVRSWLQKIAEIQRTANASKETAEKKQQCQSNTNKISSNLSTDKNNNLQTQYIQKPQSSCKSMQYETNYINLKDEVNNSTNSKQSQYCDLPYMGEITLDNCKPRRGRKPKKADICHLIFKNYGTILPKKNKLEHCSNFSSNDVNNYKIQSCEQPLNLCLRDQMNDSYSISSGDDQSDTNSSCPTPISTPQDYVRDSMLANNLKNSLNNINEHNNEEILTKVLAKSTMSSSEEKVMHPITMYYQKLLESGVLQNSNGSYKTIQKDNQLAIKIPIPSGLFQAHKLEKSVMYPIASNLDYPDQLSTPSSIKSESTSISSTTNQQHVAPQKRKRSAIFIPPMNVENTTNPATEVSICKFKFTGGSKPTLQEKKMVSVDAGGNYRYFSGTGDKATRGYEYFPRESLQHTAGLLPGVNCVGQKCSIDIPPPSAGLSNDLLQIPDTPASTMLLPETSFNGNTIIDSAASKSSSSYESKSLCSPT